MPNQPHNGKPVDLAELSRRRGLYQTVFGTPEGREVLQELLGLTRMLDKPHPATSFEAGAVWGRFETFLDIIHAMNTTDAELMEWTALAVRAQHINESTGAHFDD